MNPGDKVTYTPTNEIGILKSLQREEFAFVVFKCGDDWSNYQNYTAARCMVDELKPGWDERSAMDHFRLGEHDMNADAISYPPGD